MKPAFVPAVVKTLAGEKKLWRIKRKAPKLTRLARWFVFYLFRQPDVFLVLPAGVCRPTVERFAERYLRLLKRESSYS